MKVSSTKRLFLLEFVGVFFDMNSLSKWFVDKFIRETSHDVVESNVNA